MQITVWEVSGTFKVQGNKIPKQMQYNYYNMQYNMQNTEIVCMLDNMQYMQNNMSIHKCICRICILCIGNKYEKYLNIMSDVHNSFCHAPRGEPSSSPRHEGAGHPSTLGGGVLFKAASV